MVQTLLYHKNLTLSRLFFIFLILFFISVRGYFALNRYKVMRTVASFLKLRLLALQIADLRNSYLYSLQKNESSRYMGAFLISSALLLKVFFL